MLKFLVIVMLVCSFINLFNNHKVARSIGRNLLTDIKNLIDDKNTTDINEMDEYKAIILTNAFIILILSIIDIIIPLVAVIKFLNYDPYRYITIGFLCLEMIIFVLRITKKSPINLNNIKDLTVNSAINKLNENINKIDNISAKSIIATLIHICYFSYAFYILIIR